MKNEPCVKSSGLMQWLVFQLHLTRKRYIYYTFPITMGPSISRLTCKACVERWTRAVHQLRRRRFTDLLGQMADVKPRNRLWVSPWGARGVSSIV